MNDEQNQRVAVRTTDRVLLAYKRISREKFSEITEDYAQGISIYSQEGLGDIQIYVGAHNALDRLRERDPDLADYLGHLDNKINLLLQKTVGDGSVFDALKPQKVNLGGRGIAFHAPEKFASDDLVEFHLALLPAYTYLYFIAQVVSCRLDGERQGRDIYRISAKFALITEEDREKVIQHNFKNQVLALRSRRLANEKNAAD